MVSADPGVSLHPKNQPVKVSAGPSLMGLDMRYFEVLRVVAAQGSFAQDGQHAEIG